MGIRLATTEDETELIRLTMEYLPRFYDGHSPEFARSLLKTHLERKEIYGFFSTQKVIWVADSEDGKLDGMLCGVRKRGDQSIKISPLIVDESARNHGTGSRLFRELEDFSALEGIQKVYGTVNWRNDLARGFFEKKGFLIEGVLPEQYKDGDKEIVYARFFSDPKNKSSTQGSLQPLNSELENHFRAYLVSKMGGNYPLDAEFLSNTINGHYRNSGAVETKDKDITMVLDEAGNVQGVTCLTLKRGAPCRMFPFFAENTQTANLLAAYSIDEARKKGAKKIYTNVSVLPEASFSQRVMLSELFKSQFTIEAMLRCPYTPGTNELVLGRDLRGD